MTDQTLYATDGHKLGPRALQRRTAILDALDRAMQSTPWKRLAITTVMSEAGGSPSVPSGYWQYFPDLESGVVALAETRTPDVPPHILRVLTLIAAEGYPRARAVRDAVKPPTGPAQPTAAPATAWWFDTGEFDYDPPKLHATEQGARAAAVEHWRHFNYPRDVEFGWLQEPDDDPDHPDPNRGHELLAAGQKTGHFVRPIAVQGAAQTSPEQPARADLTRYPIGNDGTGRIALWCNGCEVVGGIDDAGNHIDDAPIWTEDDTAEQVTELCLANLAAIAERHENEHHGDAPEPPSPRFDFTQYLEPKQPPPAPHRVTVTTVCVINMTDDSDPYDEPDYDVQHTPQCDALPYGATCWLDEQERDVGTDDWPTEPGVYIVTGEPVKSFNGEVTEYDFYIDFERVQDAEP